MPIPVAVAAVPPLPLSGRALPAATTPPPAGTAAPVATTPTEAPPTTTAPPVTPSTTPPTTPSTPTTPATTPPTTTAPTEPPSTSAEPSVTTSTSPAASTPAATTTVTVTPRPASAPAIADSGVSWVSVGVALLVLAAAAAVIWAVQRRAAERRGAAVPSGEEPVGPEPVIAPVEPVEPVDVTAPVTVTAVGVVEPGTTALLVSLGEAMVDSGYAVTQVQTTLHQVARVNGAPGAEIIVLPTALLVSVPGEAAVETAAAAAGASRLRLDQIDAVSRVVAGAESGRLAPARAMERLASARAMSPPFGPVGRTVGYVVLTVGLALILRASAIELLVAAALGAVVGLLQLAAPRLTSAYQAVLPVAASFLVSTAVFLLARGGWDVGVFAPLVAPLVTFLPGALLTTGVLELSTGQMISGSGRLATGLMQLVLLALGIVAGAQLVGVPASTVGEPAVNPLGELTPWLGVAVFGVGVVVHNCARRASLGWILLVLYVAYGAQVVGGLFLGGVLSAFVGALVMAPVAVFVAAQRTGPPTQVSFLPAFWLLVPGALGLVGVTKLIEQDLSDALDALVTTGATMIGIAFGVLIGLALGSSIARAPLPGLRRR